MRKTQSVILVTGFQFMHYRTWNQFQLFCYGFACWFWINGDFSRLRRNSREYCWILLPDIFNHSSSILTFDCQFPSDEPAFHYFICNYVDNFSVLITYSWSLCQNVDLSRNSLRPFRSRGVKSVCWLCHICRVCLYLRKDQSDSH
jgi:hypothetical protein